MRWAVALVLLALVVLLGLWLLGPLIGATSGRLIPVLLMLMMFVDMLLRVAGLIALILLIVFLVRRLGERRVD
jgi:hypothetical protein